MMVKSMRSPPRSRMMRSLLVLALAVGASASRVLGAEPVRPAFRGAPPTEATRLIERVQAGRHDVPRVELAARLALAGLATSEEYGLLRENAARELSGRPDGKENVSADEIKKADAAIDRQIAVLRGAAAPPTFAELAKRPGRPQIPELDLVYLNPLGEPAQANAWKNIIVHQTEGPAGAARAAAMAQAANPTKRGVMLWVETDGLVYWATAENAIPTHGDGANRNDNKYIDNSKTYRSVIKTNSIGVEFVGNYPDVTKPATAKQVQAWLTLVRFLQERYGIPPDNVYAHNWIDFKDRRYCEGCDLATLARALAYVPGQSVAGGSK
jgi:N-acetylmuramoyl-L-alanine amidase